MEIWHGQRHSAISFPETFPVRLIFQYPSFAPVTVSDTLTDKATERAKGSVWITVPSYRPVLRGSHGRNLMHQTHSQEQMEKMHGPLLVHSQLAFSSVLQLKTRYLRE